MIEIKFMEILNRLVQYFSILPNMKHAAVVVSVSLLNTFIIILVFNRTIFKFCTPYLRNVASIIIALFLNTFLLFCFSIYHTKFTSFILANNLQGLILVLIILNITVAFAYFNSLYKALRNKNIKVIAVQLGPIQLKSALLSTKSLLQNIKRASYLLLLPLLLLLINPSNKYLYAIIFDNSPSMDLQINLAKDYFNNAIALLKDNSVYVISNFPECVTEENCEVMQKKYARNIETIIAADRSKLVAETNILYTQKELRDYLQSDKLAISNCGSPIMEAIWQNFNNCIELTDANQYTKKKLLIFSDAEDNLFRKDLGFTTPKTCIFDYNKNNITINDFFDEISLIKYNGTSPINMTNLCSSINVYEGSDDYSIKQSVEEQIEDVIFDQYFILIISMLLFFGILLIQTLK